MDRIKNIEDDTARTIREILGLKDVEQKTVVYREFDADQNIRPEIEREQSLLVAHGLDSRERATTINIVLMPGGRTIEIRDNGKFEIETVLDGNEVTKTVWEKAADGFYVRLNRSQWEDPETPTAEDFQAILHDVFLEVGRSISPLVGGHPWSLNKPEP